MSTHDSIILVGSRWHDPWTGGEILFNLLTEVGLSPLRTDQGSILDPERLGSTSLVVFYCEGRWLHDEPESRRLTPEQEEALVNYVQGGGAFLGIHGATVFREEYDRYHGMIGGRFLRHEPMRTFTVRLSDPDHPITRGICEYEVYDEPYEVDMAPSCHMLLHWDAGEKNHPLGWAKTSGEGRVCYLANGHDKRSLEVPEFQRLVRQAADWCVCRV